MAFANIAVLYTPRPADATASLWGTDVRKLLSAAVAAPDDTTITSHGTGGNVTRTVDPFTTSSTDVTDSNFGFGVESTDMNSVSGARRFYPAGDHTVSVKIKNTLSPIAKTGCQLVFSAYRVASAGAGRGRTLLGTVTSSAFSTGTANAFVVVSLALSLAQIIFEPDETIQYSFELIAPGTAVTGETYIFRTAHTASDGHDGRIDTPVLGIIVAESAEAVGVGTASLDPLNISVPLEVTGVGTADLSTITSALVTLEALGIGTADSVLTVSETLEALGVGTADARIDMNIDDVPEGGGGTTVHPVFSVFA